MNGDGITHDRWKLAKGSLTGQTTIFVIGYRGEFGAGDACSLSRTGLSGAKNQQLL
jgi:hypothetical protein